MIELSIASDGAERVPYLSDTFPLHVSSCSLSMYPDMRCMSHWHGDHEFLVVERGRCICRINGFPVMLSAGEGLYIAPRNVHGIEAIDGGDCGHLCVVFPTALLGASPQTAQAVQAHLAAHEAAHYLHLHPSAPKHSAVIEGLLTLRRVATQQTPEARLETLSILYRLIADLGAAVRSEETLPKTDRNLAQLREMMGYIRLHTDRPLTLADIARAGKLSRTACGNAFRRILHTSPMQYLIHCRLERGMELLLSTSLSVTEIAHRCGFCSGSYFAELLRERTGCTPGEYRRTNSEQTIPRYND